MRFASSGIGFALVFSAQTAGAEAEAITLVYRAAGDGCPAQADFQSEIRARTTKVSFGDSGRRFEVNIEHGEAGYVGTLSIREAEGAPSERRIDGSDCADVASALGLIAALAVDPDANTAPRAELQIEPAPADPRPVEPAPIAEPTPPAPPRSAGVAPVPAEPEPAPARWVWSAGLGLSLHSGPAPKWLLALGPEAELSRQSGGQLQSVGLSLFAAQTGTLGPSDDRARFRWLAARLALCPFGLEDRWRFRAAAVVDVGAVRAEGRAVDVAESATRGWLSAGLGGRLGYRLGQLYLDVSAAALANLTRDRFVFESPETTVHEVPLAAFDAGISVGWVFP